MKDFNKNSRKIENEVFSLSTYQALKPYFYELLDVRTR